MGLFNWRLWLWLWVQVRGGLLGWGLALLPDDLLEKEVDLLVEDDFFYLFFNESIIHLYMPLF